MKSLVSVFVVLGLFAAVYAVNDRPIIGIMAEPADNGKTYIAASYVKWVESAGGRAAPLIYEKYDEAKLMKMLKSINGVLFPGGGCGFSGKYYRTLVTIFNYAKNVNDKGDYFPLWGTCLGFEELLVLQANNTGILDSGFKSEDLSLALELTQTAESSRFFKAMPKDLKEIIVSKKVTFNNHQAGITPTHFNSHSKLTSFYDVLSTNKDTAGSPFVSTIEAKKYPFYGVQWHPEKVMYEWIPKEINHGYESVEVNSWTARFFVNECRKSDHHFPDTTSEKKALIYEHTPKYTGDSGSFMQKYFFDN